MAKTKKSPLDKKKAPMQTEALALVNDRFTRARDARVTEQDPIWERSYNNWRGKLDQSLFPWRSKLFVPWSFTVVETIIPKVFARDPKWRAIAQSPEFPDDGPATIQDLLNYQWGIMDMRSKMYDYIKDSLMYSKGFAKVTWKFTPRTKTYRRPVAKKDGTVDFETTTVQDLEYDDPQVDIIDPLDIYIDPDATTSGFKGNNKYIVHRMLKTMKELKDNPNYSNVDKVKLQSKNGGAAADMYVDKIARYQNNVPEKDKHSDMVEVLEYWERDRLVVVANRSVVLRDTPNPYDHKEIPFVELDDYRDPHKLYGQSELSVIDPLQREINSIRNQRRDYDNLALNPVIMMIPGTLRNPNSARMAPGNAWMVSDLNSISTFELPQLQGVSSDIEERTIQDVQRTVAIDEIGIGLLPDGSARRSATEVVTATSMAGKRFAIKIALLEEAVKKIGYLVFALDQQFIDQEKLISVIGERGASEWVKFSPEDIRGQYSITIETGSMLPKDEIAARQEAIQLLQYITPVITPVLGSNPNVLMPILRMILDTYDLPGKQDILDELQQALGAATQQIEQQQAIDQTNSVAQAAAPLLAQQQAEAEPPSTAQGARADLELEALTGG